MIVLGLESSCDETAVALVDDRGNILAEQLFSQFDAHRAYGGVVPEIAARHHIKIMPEMIRGLLKEHSLDLTAIDAIAATGGPGLIGGLMIATTLAKAMSLASKTPYLAINHLEGHTLSARLSNPSLEFPYLLLLVSGGHCQIIAVEGVGTYHQLATTLDDAVGEAFDKSAKMLGLGYPGGPAVEAMAAKARHPHRFTLPRPMVGKEQGDFSFSGLKAAMHRQVSTLNDHGKTDLSEADKADLAAAFELAVCDIMVDRLQTAMNHTNGRYKTLVIAGGVGANQRLRTALTDFCDQKTMQFYAPPLALCTDNAAMIAWAGIERLRLEQPADPYSFKARPRWPLAELAAPVSC